MNVAAAQITEIRVDDVRVPSSDSLLGSDLFHRKPDYFVAVMRLSTETEHVGWSVVFGIGAGKDWLVNGLRDHTSLLVGLDIRDFVVDPGKVHRRLVEHHQLRWLSDGVFRMLVSGLVNALWDVWAKLESKPLWTLLVEIALSSIDWLAQFVMCWFSMCPIQKLGRRSQTRTITLTVACQFYHDFEHFFRILLRAQSG